MVKRRPAKKAYRVIHSRGYILINEKDHPLAQKNGYVYEHRYNFYNENVGKDLICEKCGSFWGWRTYIDHIDHIDKDRANNQIDNLRPLCNGCNTKRKKKNYCESDRFSSVTYEGKTQTAHEWTREGFVKVTRATILNRISKGWSVHDALTTLSATNPSKALNDR